MHRKKAIVALAVLALGLGSGSARCAVTRGLSTTFAEGLIEGVPLGSRFALEARPIDITNKGELPTKVTVTASIPIPAEMRAGYEPIPESAWLSFSPKMVEVKPGETGKVVMTLFVPDDPALAGKRYQVMLQVQASPEEGVVVLGLKPRLMFAVAESRPPKGGKPKVKVTLNPQVLARMTPYEAAGRTGVMEFDCGTIKAENPWDEAMTYEVFSDPGAVGRIDVAPHETVVTDPSWVEVNPRILVLQPQSRAEMAVTARVPISAEHFGKNYVAALRTVAVRKGQKPVEVFNKVRIMVPNPVALTVTATGAQMAK